jgi:HSP20 family molecular chaperone IbpA
MAPCSEDPRPASFDEFFSDYFGQVLFVPAFACAGEASATTKPDVRESPREWVVVAEIPGVRKEDIVLEIRDGVVRLTLPKKPA